MTAATNWCVIQAFVASKFHIKQFLNCVVKIPFFFFRQTKRKNNDKMKNYRWNGNARTNERRQNLFSYSLVCFAVLCVSYFTNRNRFDDERRKSRRTKSTFRPKQSFILLSVNFFFLAALLSTQLRVESKRISRQIVCLFSFVNMIIRIVHLCG